MSCFAVTLCRGVSYNSFRKCCKWSVMRCYSNCCNNNNNNNNNNNIIETSHTIRKVLQCEAWSLSGGDHRWFKGSTRKKRPVTRDIHIIIIIIIIIIITNADCESRSDTSDSRGNWNHLKMIQKIPGQHTADSSISRNYQKKKPHWAQLHSLSIYLSITLSLSLSLSLSLREVLL